MPISPTWHSPPTRDAGAFRTVLGAGVKSSGQSYGENAAFGAAIPLDFFEGNSSRPTDRALGINTSSLFFEFDFLELNGLGATDSIEIASEMRVPGGRM